MSKILYDMDFGLKEKIQDIEQFLKQCDEGLT